MDLEVMPFLERKIATTLVDEALRRDYRISVYDGGEWVVKRERDKRTILAALASTDTDTLSFHRESEGTGVGVISLIWGNGEDLISDYTDNEAVRALVERVEDRLRKE